MNHRSEVTRRVAGTLNLVQARANGAGTWTPLYDPTCPLRGKLMVLTHLAAPVFAAAGEHDTTQNRQDRLFAASMLANDLRFLAAAGVLWLRQLSDQPDEEVRIRQAWSVVAAERDRQAATDGPVSYASRSMLTWATMLLDELGGGAREVLAHQRQGQETLSSLRLRYHVVRVCALANLWMEALATRGNES